MCYNIRRIGSGKMEDLTRLPNIGKFLEEQLHEIGVTSLEDLKEIGSRDAWLKIKEIDPSACYHRLMALEGAIEGIPKKDLPSETKEKLKCFYNENKE